MPELAANPRDLAYDIETYPNIFSCVLVHIASGTRWIYEISDRVNHSRQLYDMLLHMQRCQMRMVGFNNVGFDYPVLHTFFTLFTAQGDVSAAQLHAKAQQIIGSQNSNRWSNIIWPNQRVVEQLDLYLIHHFDNVAKATGLKALEFNMRSHSVEDLPFDPLQPVPIDQFDKLISYNAHDVSETIRFYFHTLPAIEMREALTEKFQRDFMNHNDTKIGKDFFVMELEKVSPGICFDNSTGRKQPRQTPRPAGIPLRDVIFPYIRFNHPELSRVLEYLKTVTIFNTKSAPELKDLHAIVNGFRFDFGTGGIHGSVNRRVVRSDDTHIVVDADVSSFYPNLAIKNRVFPEHLGETFCDVYESLYHTRKTFPKGTPENETYKLALNGVYGDSNNEYGPFLDPKYTMTITINGQLLLCMLSEWLVTEAGAEMIQANTDGITVRIPRTMRPKYDEICKRWEAMTRLELEFADYEAMWIRDVNSYMAKTTAGKVKRIGAYAYVTARENPGTREKPWHKDQSALVVPKAAEAAMIHGKDLRQFITAHTDAFDFMQRVKVPRGSKLMWGNQIVQNTCRYYVAHNGAPLVKIMPPTAKKPDAERRIGVEAGWNVRVCNVLDDWDWSALNYEYYIAEAQKLMLTGDNT